MSNGLPRLKNKHYADKTNSDQFLKSVITVIVIIIVIIIVTVTLTNVITVTITFQY